MNIAAVCLDLDGTLLTSNGTISEENIRAVQDLDKFNVQVILASGRPEESLKNFTIRNLHIPTYKICFNGALVVSPTGTIIKKSLLNSQDVFKVVTLAEKNKIAVNFSTQDKWINFDPGNNFERVDKYNETLNDIRINTLSQMKQLYAKKKVSVLKIGMHISK